MLRDHNEMAAIVDSGESEKIMVLGAREFIAVRVSIMTALAASCILVATARAGDFAAPEKKSGETASSALEDTDVIPDTGLDADGLHLLQTVLGTNARTVVFSTHNRAWASAISTTTLELVAGRIRPSHEPVAH